jgi:hypothetical protein
VLAAVLVEVKYHWKGVNREGNLYLIYIKRWTRGVPLGGSEGLVTVWKQMRLTGCGGV